MSITPHVFLGLLIDNYISNEMKFLGLQVRKSYNSGLKYDQKDK